MEQEQQQPQATPVEQPEGTQEQAPAPTTAPADAPVNKEGQGMSREELKKLKKLKKAQKKAEKEAKKKARLEAEALKKLRVVEYETEEPFGDITLIRSQTNGAFTFTELSGLDETLKGQEVRVRARVHRATVPGSLAFVTLRKGYYSAQAVANKKDTSGDLIKYIKNTPKESIVDIVGTVTVPDTPIDSVSQSGVEIQILRYYVVSRSVKVLPFQIDDAGRTMTREEFNKQGDVEGEDEEEIAEDAPEEEGKLATVGVRNRLKCRVLDLRVPTNRAIFKIQSTVCMLYREFLVKRGFVEIHSPKILGGSSEGGAEVFKTKYFGRDASLAQSPQLFKQMAIMGDFEKVFEIGPVFRAENSNTPRHLCEFTGLDLEMEIKESYFEVMEVIGQLFNHMFKGLNEHCPEELEVVNKQFPYEPFLFIDEPLMLTFEEGVQMLNDAGFQQNPHKDLETENERELGKIIREKYNTDFYILHRYPEEARPFYTMLCKDDPKWTCSYDVFMRGEEIISGAQRVHDTAFIRERAKAKGMDPDDIGYYCDSFKYGAYPHGGFGTGLERVVKLFLNLHNVRQTSLFPRTPKLLVP